MDTKKISEQAAGYLIVKIQNALLKDCADVEAVWNYIGYDETEKENRCDLVLNRLKSLLQEIGREEDEMLSSIETQVEEKKKILHDYHSKIYGQPFYPPRHCSAFELLKILNAKIAELALFLSNRYEQVTSSSARITNILKRLDWKNGSSDERSDAMDRLSNWNAISEVVETMSIQHQQKETGELLTRLDDKQLLEHLVNLAMPNNMQIQLIEEAHAVLQSVYLKNKDRYDTLKANIVAIQRDIEVKSKDPTEIFILQSKDDDDNQPPLNATTFSFMENWRARLVKCKAMLMGQCEELREHLRVFWHRLAIPLDYQTDFLQKHTGCSTSVLDALQTEAENCQLLKWDRLPQYVTCMQGEIRLLLEKCLLELNDDLKAILHIDFDKANNEYLLADDRQDSIAHLEQQLEEVKKIYAQMPSILESVYQYRQLWKQYLAIEESIKSPLILANRGGILLKTEKERKRILRELARYQDEVMQQIQIKAQHDSSNSHIILPNGQTFPEMVEDLWDSFHQNKMTNRPGRPRPKSSDVRTCASGQSNTDIQQLPKRSADAVSMVKQ